MPTTNPKILITGSTGMLGSALSDHLKYLGYKNILKPSSKELNLFDLFKIKKFFI